MSDPMTNVKIEDVLSSIRRLVSEGERLRDPGSPMDDGEGDAGYGQGRDEDRDILELGAEHRADEAFSRGSGGERSEDSPVRFVLTSAYRVEDREPEPDPGSGRHPETDSGEETGLSETADEPDLVAEAEPEADASEISEALFDEPDSAEGEVAAEDATGSALAGEIVWIDDDAPTGLSDPETAAVESARPSSDLASEDGETAAHEVPDWVAQGQAELDAIEAGTADGTEAREPGDAGMSLSDGAVRSPDRRALESTIAELEAAISDAADEWEPDGSEETPVMDWDAASEVGVFFSRRFASGGPIEDAEFSEPADREHEIDADELAEKFEAAEARFAEADIEDAPDPLEDQLTAYLEQDEVLDEQTLRRMVAEIVREELQGPLGERITRNVRKLVRREIYRALAEHGFD